ncbi:MAG: hypothetical protein KDG50_09865 [Chromatiales bacterium]|nr:hypothetical protein [Chromatiales bacterium]
MSEADAATAREWSQLSDDERLRLRIDYGAYLDTLPPTCSLDEKHTRFGNWLAERDIHYSTSD